MPTLLYGLTVLISAGLMFWVELFFARLLLPLLGGSPAVWNTCLFFFQGTLLLGYGYAHLLQRWLPARGQVAVHGLLLCLPWAFFPLGVSPGWADPAGTPPVLWLLGLLAACLGLPFLAVSISAPLLQSWYARLGRDDSHDPYPLYAASNLGSLLGLLGYPFIIEPSLSLARQSALWSWGYGALMLGTLACGALLWRAAGRGPATPADADTGGPPSWPQRLRWVLRSFVPACLLYGVTTAATTDIAAVPLLWVLPLALYLLSFVLAFARRQPIPRNLVAACLPPVLAAMLVTHVVHVPYPPWALLGVMLPLHMLGFFGAAYLLHRDLAAERPAARYLTGYYLWIAWGGLLAGALCALAAPLLFTTALEYPLLLMLAALLLPDDRAQRKGDGSWPAGPRWVFRTLAGSLGAVLAFLAVGFSLADLGANLVAFAVVLPVLVAIACSVRRGLLRAGVGLLLAVLIAQCTELGPQLLHRDRGFFGLHRVFALDGFHHYASGLIVHGRQHTDPERRREPLAYYYPSAPIGQVFGAWTRAHPSQGRVAVLGLGIGGLAAYAREGQDWRFYEIDPVVERIARDARFFSYLQDAPARLEVVLGDARLSLAREAQAGEARHDLLMLDAFTSDSIPVHLLTREAFAIYLDRLAKDGVLAVNITNKYIALEGLLAALAEAHGLVGRVRLDDRITPEEKAAGKAGCHCVVLARAPEHLAFLEAAGWRELSGVAPTRLWTDDYADLLSVLKLR